MRIGMKVGAVALGAAVAAAALAAETGTGTEAAPPAATNLVPLTEREAALVAARRRAAAASEARRVKEAALARVRRLAPGADGQTAAQAPAVVLAPVVSQRKRLLGMDAQSVPGMVVYTYAQGARTWCETNEVKALTFRAARNRYSKLKVIVAAKAAGKWDALKAGIKAAGLEDEWLACQYVEYGDPAFVSATNAVVAAGVATAEEIAAFLERARDN